MFVRISLIVLITLGCFGAARAQQPRAPIEAPPGRTIQLAPVLRFGPDSVKWKAAFSTLWPYLKPSTGALIRVQQRFQRVSRIFASRGIDSAVAYDSVRKDFDTSIERTIMTATLMRAGFSSDDLTNLTTFLKTPTGRKYLASDTKLHDARNSDLDRYADRLLAHVLDPMMAPKPKSAIQRLDDSTRTTK